MSELIEFEPVDTIAAGALGVPGQRTFLIQARRGGQVLSVLLEKEQVGLLAAEIDTFLEQVAPGDDVPLPPDEDAACGRIEPAEPLFRARLIGLGYDVDRSLVLIELREHAEEADDGEPVDRDDTDGFVARLYATRAQVRAMARHASLSVVSGRPPCPLCEFPMDPAGHICPRWN